VRRIRNDRKI
jgi:hypothetical protein